MDNVYSGSEKVIDVREFLQEQQERLNELMEDLADVNEDLESSIVGRPKIVNPMRYTS